MNNILKEGLDIQKIYNVATRYYRAALKRNNSKEFCDFIQNCGFDKDVGASGGFEPVLLRLDDMAEFRN